MTMDNRRWRCPIVHRLPSTIFRTLALKQRNNMDQPAPVAFLLKPTRPPMQRFAYIGVPHDAATSLGNPGGRFGPQALRDALRGVFDWRLQEGRLADQDTGV